MTNINIKDYFKNLLSGEPLLSTKELDMEEDWENIVSSGRWECIKHYNFCIPSKEMIEALIPLSPLLEIGAGAGFLSRILSDRGADIIATDYNGSKRYGQDVGAYFPVKSLGARASVLRYSERNVLCSWPCYSRSWAYDAITVMPMDKIFAYIGEGFWGCTADEKFHSFIDTYYDCERIEIPSWPAIHDDLFLLTKRSEPCQTNTW